MTHWTSSNYDYGAIFIQYLIDQYDNTAIMNMCATNLVDVAAVEAATDDDFNTIFNDFTQALVMSDTDDSTNSRYEFATLDLLAVQPNGRGGLTTTNSYSAGSTVSGSLYPYQLSFLQWTNAFATMNLSGDSIVGTTFGLSQ